MISPKDMRKGEHKLTAGIIVFLFLLTAFAPITSAVPLGLNGDDSSSSNGQNATKPYVQPPYTEHIGGTAGKHHKPLSEQPQWSVQPNATSVAKRPVTSIDTPVGGGSTGSQAHALTVANGGQVAEHKISFWDVIHLITLPYTASFEVAFNVLPSATDWIMDLVSPDSDVMKASAMDVHTWDGGGADVYAGTMENWVSDVHPESGDTVVFDAGALPCTWNLTDTLDAFYINATYTGTVTQGASFGVTLYSQGSGTFTGSTSYVLTDSGNFTQSGGALSQAVLRLTMSGNGKTIACSGSAFVYQLTTLDDTTLTTVDLLVGVGGYTNTAGKTLTLTGVDLFMYDSSEFFDNPGIIAGTGSLVFDNFADAPFNVGNFGTLNVNVTFQNEADTAPIYVLTEDLVTTKNIEMWSGSAIQSVTVNTTTYKVSCAALTIGTRGVLNAGSSLITCSGNWDSSAGTFAKGTSTVNMTGASKTIKTVAGGTFYKLNISGTVSTITNSFNVTYDLTVTSTGTLTIATGKSVNYAPITGAVLINRGMIDGTGTLYIDLYKADTTCSFGTVNAPTEIRVLSGTSPSRVCTMASDATFGSTLGIYSLDLPGHSASLDVSASNYSITANGITIGWCGIIIARGSTVTCTDNWQSQNDGEFRYATSTLVMSGDTKTLEHLWDPLQVYNIQITGTITLLTSLIVYHNISVTNDLEIGAGNFIWADEEAYWSTDFTFTTGGTFDVWGYLNVSGNFDSSTITLECDIHSPNSKVVLSGTGTTMKTARFCLLRDFEIRAGATITLNSDVFVYGVFTETGSLTRGAYDVIIVRLWQQTSGALASTNANWYGGAKPAAGQGAVFNGSSVTSCTWDLALALAIFWVDVGYTGTITPNVGFSTTSDFIPCATGSTFAAGTYTYACGGNWDSSNGTFTGAITLTVSGTAKTLKITTSFTKLTVSGSYTMLSALTLTGDMVITGTLTDTTYAISCAGNWDASSGSFVCGTSTVTLTGTAKTLKATIASPFDTLIISTGTRTLTGNIGTGALTLTGTLDGSTYTIQCSGNLDFSAGTFTYNTCTVNMTGASKTIKMGTQWFYNLNISGTISTITSSFTVYHRTLVTSTGVFTIGNGLTVTSWLFGASGYWSNAGSIDGPGTLTINTYSLGYTIIFGTITAPVILTSTYNSQAALLTAGSNTVFTAPLTITFGGSSGSGSFTFDLSASNYALTVTDLTLSGVTNGYGSLNCRGSKIIASGNVLVTGVNGQMAMLVLAASWFNVTGTFTALQYGYATSTTGTVNFTASSTISIANSNTIFYNMNVAYAGQVTTLITGSVYLKHNLNLNGGTLTPGAYLIIFTGTAGSAYSITGSGTFTPSTFGTGSYQVLIQRTAYAADVTATFSTSIALAGIAATSAGNSGYRFTVNQASAITSTRDFRVFVTAVNVYLTWSTNGYALTTRDLIISSSSTQADAVMNLGASTVTVSGNVSVTLSSSTATLNLNSAYLIIGQNFTSSGAVLGGTSTTNFTGSAIINMGTATNYYFYNINLAYASMTVTLTSHLFLSRTLNLNTGTLNPGAYVVQFLAGSVYSITGTGTFNPSTYLTGSYQVLITRIASGSDATVSFASSIALAGIAATSPGNSGWRLTINQASAITSTRDFRLFVTATNVYFSWYTNGYALNAKDMFILPSGSSSETGLYCGASTVTLTGNVTITPSSSTAYLYLQTSFFIVGQNFTSSGSNAALYGGTSTTNFTGSAIINQNGGVSYTFYNVNLAYAGKTVTLTNHLYVSHTVTLNTGILTPGAYYVAFAAGTVYSVAGAGTFNPSSFGTGSYQVLVTRMASNSDTTATFASSITLAGIAAMNPGNGYRFTVQQASAITTTRDFRLFGSYSGSILDWYTMNYALTTVEFVMVTSSSAAVNMYLGVAMVMVSGNVTTTVSSSSASFVAGTSTFNMTGTSRTLSAMGTFYNLNISGTITTVTNSFTVNRGITVTSTATLTIGSGIYIIDMAPGGGWANRGSIGGSGTLYFDHNSGDSTMIFGTINCAVQIRTTAGASDRICTLGANTVFGSTLTVVGSASYRITLDLSASNYALSATDITIANNGIIRGRAGIISCSGNWYLNTGSFTYNTCTVNMTGTSKTINHAGAFYSLNISGTISLLTSSFTTYGSLTITSTGTLAIPTGLLVVYTAVGATWTNRGSINGLGTIYLDYTTADTTITFGVVNTPVIFRGTAGENANRICTLGANTVFGSTVTINSVHASFTMTLDLGASAYSLTATTISIGTRGKLDARGVVTATTVTVNAAGVLSNSGAGSIVGDLTVTGGTVTGTASTFGISGTTTDGASGVMTQSTGTWTFATFIQSGASSTFTQGGNIIANSMTFSAGTFTGLNTYTVSVSVTFTINSGGTVATGTKVKLITTADGCTIVSGSTLANLDLNTLTINGDTTLSGSRFVSTRYALTVASGKTFTLNYPFFVTDTGITYFTNNGIITGGSVLDMSAYGTAVYTPIKLGTINCPVEVHMRSDGSISGTVVLSTAVAFGSTLYVYSSSGSFSVTLDTNNTNNYALSATQITIGTLGIINGRASKITDSGNWDSSAGTFTYATSTVNMTGTTKTIKTGASGTFYNLNISGTISTITNSFSITHGFTVTSTGVFTIGAGLTATFAPVAGGSLINRGTIGATGTLYADFNTADASASFGTVNAPTTIRALAGATASRICTMASTATFGSTLTVSSAHVSNTMTLDLSASNFAISATDVTIGTRGVVNGRGSAITCSGNWDSSAGAFTYGTSNLIMSGATKTLKMVGGQSLYDLNVTGTIALLSAIVATHTVTVTGGTLDLSATNYALTAVDITIGASGVINGRGSIITCSGNWDSSLGTFTKGTTTVIMSGVAKTLKVATVGFYALNLTGSITLQSAIWASSALNIAGTITQATYRINVSGSASNALIATGSWNGDIYINGTGLSYSVAITAPFSATGRIYSKVITKFTNSTNGNITVTPPAATYGAMCISKIDYDAAGPAKAVMFDYALSAGTATFTAKVLPSWYYKLYVDGVFALKIQADGSGSITWTYGSWSDKFFNLTGTASSASIWYQTSGNLASTDANWLAGSCPVVGDDVLFNDTSVASCTWDLATTLSNFTVAIGYTGTITATSGFSITGDFVPCFIGTTFVAGSYTFTCGGNWDSSAGTFTAGTSLIVLSGASKTLKTADAGAFLYNVTVSGTISMISDLNVSNNLSITGSLTGTPSYQLSVTGATTLINGIMVQGNGLWAFGSFTQSGGSSLFEGGTQVAFTGVALISAGTFNASTTTTFTTTFTLNGAGATFNAGAGTVTFSSTTILTAGTLNAESATLKSTQNWDTTTITWVPGTSYLNMSGAGTTLKTSASQTIYGLKIAGTITTISSTNVTKNLVIYGSKTLSIGAGLYVNLNCSGGGVYYNGGTITGAGTMYYSFDTANRVLMPFGTVNAPTVIRALATATANRLCSIGIDTAFGSTFMVLSEHAGFTMTFSHGGNYLLTVTGAVTLSTRGIMIQGTGLWTFSSTYTQNGVSSLFQGGISPASQLVVTGVASITAGTFDATTTTSFLSPFTLNGAGAVFNAGVGIVIFSTTTAFTLGTFNGESARLWTAESWDTSLITWTAGTSCLNMTGAVKTLKTGVGQALYELRISGSTTTTSSTNISYSLTIYATKSLSIGAGRYVDLNCSAGGTYVNVGSIIGTGIMYYSFNTADATVTFGTVNAPVIIRAYANAIGNRICTLGASTTFAGSLTVASAHPVWAITLDDGANQLLGVWGATTLGSEGIMIQGTGHWTFWGTFTENSVTALFEAGHTINFLNGVTISAGTFNANNAYLLIGHNWDSSGGWFNGMNSVANMSMLGAVAHTAYDHPFNTLNLLAGGSVQANPVLHAKNLTIQTGATLTVLVNGTTVFTFLDLNGTISSGGWFVNITASNSNVGYLNGTWDGNIALNGTAGFYMIYSRCPMTGSLYTNRTTYLSVNSTAGSIRVTPNAGWTNITMRYINITSVVIGTVIAEWWAGTNATPAQVQWIPTLVPFTGYSAKFDGIVFELAMTNVLGTFPVTYNGAWSAHLITITVETISVPGGGGGAAGSDISFDFIWQISYAIVDFTTEVARGDVVEWHWAFGDGSYSESEDPQHTYRAPGSYVVTLVVVDSHGRTSTRTHLVNITQMMSTDTIFSHIPVWMLLPIIALALFALIGTSNRYVRFGCIVALIALVVCMLIGGKLG